MKCCNNAEITGSTRYFSKLQHKEVENAKTNIPNYRLHKATGQAFVELEGRRFYLGKHGSKASREEYEQRLAEYLSNNRKLSPAQQKAGTSCQELVVHFIDWAEGYYQKNGKQTYTFSHCKLAV